MRLVTCAVFLSLMLTTQPAFSADGKISGKVSDRQTGEPLIGANVSIEGTVLGAATDLDGVFIVTDVPEGSYTVIVSYVGYEDNILTSIVVAGGKTTSLEVTLDPTGIDLNPVTVTASKRPEKMLDSPADVAVLSADDIDVRPVLTPAEHLKSLPGVDVASTGLTQSNVVVRGFNNIFSGALLSLVDNRIARVPSLRLNAYNFISTPSMDIERVEVVLGPGSALYGPNSASGVFHMITKSPFGSEGTTVSIGGGEQEVVMGSFRHASSFNDKVGIKITGQYYQGRDFANFDPVEEEDRAAAIAAFAASPDSAHLDTFLDTLKVGARDFDVEKISLEGRVDFRLSPDATFIFNSGFNQASNIELTGIGAGQAKDWTYFYLQGRLNFKDLFLQAFMNRSDAGETFLLRSGDPIVDKSSMFVAQAQHSAALGSRLFFTYGTDMLLTRPDTEGTINGLNEDDDEINEFGVYLQSELNLASQLKFVGAIRFDDHSRLEDPVISPRAALVLKASPTNTFRFTYNRAFSTPTSNNLFLDLLASQNISNSLSAFEGALGFAPRIDIRAQGVPDETGFNFSRSPNGRPQFRSPFAPVAGLSNTDFIDLDNPVFTNVMWNVASGAVTSQFVPAYVEGLLEAGFDEFTANALGDLFETNVVPTTISNVKNNMMSLDPTTGEFSLVEDVVNVPKTKETITQTLEVGYKGILNKKLVLAADVYYTKVEDFGGPLIVETPNVFLDPATLSASLAAEFAATLADPANVFVNATLIGALDDPEKGGNGNGSAVDELAALYTGAAAGIPFGTVTFKEATDPTAVILTYRNFGDIDMTGADVSFTYYANRNWSLSGKYSYVSDDFFPKGPDQPHDIALNAPSHKAGASIQYKNDEIGFNGQLRYRWSDGFPVNTGVFIGSVGAFSVLDLSLNYHLPFAKNTRLSLTVQNLLDHKHIEMVGAPKIGRLILGRLTQSFGH